MICTYDRDESERQLLATLILDPMRIADARTMVREDDFTPGWNRTVWSAILTLEDAAQPIDVTTIAARIEADLGHKVPKIYSRLTELSGLATSSAHAKYWTGRVAAFGRLDAMRALGKAMWEAADATEADPAQVGDFLEEHTKAIYDLQRMSLESSEVSLADAARAEAVKLDRMRASGAPPGLRTGFYDLDKTLGGLRKSELIILAARPSMGKTALAWQIAANAATMFHESLGDRRANVYFVSLEMGRSSVVQRHLSSVAEVDGHRLSRGRHSDAEQERVYQAARDASEVNLTLCDAPSLTLQQIRSKVRRNADMHGIDLLVVDYIGIVKVTGKLDRHLQVGEISAGLKTLARELDIPVLALSQLNRSLESRPNKRPILADIRESGNVEQDADAVAFIYRECVYEDDADKGAAEVIVAKHRNGPIGTIHLRFDPTTTRFLNHAAPEVTTVRP